MASPVWWQEMCFFCPATRTSSITKSHLVPYIFIGRSLPKQVFYCRITDYCVVMSNFFLHMNLLTLELLLNAYRACCLGLVFIHKHKMLFLNNSSVAWSASFLSRQLFLQECSNYDNNFYRNQSHFTMRLAILLFFTRETSMTYPLLKMFESSQCSSE